MIASLKGVVAHKDASSAVIECGGVGYGVVMSLTSLSSLGAVGSEARLLIHTHVGQDVLRLYGFVDAEERRTFELLIGISGVGPRLALAVLSTFTSAELADVVGLHDTAALVRIPGVGKKTAERLALELKDRLVPAKGATGKANGMLEDLKSALRNIGFANAIADRAAQDALTAHPEQTDVAILVREALRATTRR